jgi:cytidylate kinase
MAIVTISRGTYSGGKKLAEMVAERLGYRCLERAVVVTEAARSHHIAFDKLSDAMMEPPGVLERMKSEKYHYVSFVREELAKEVRKGNLVYHGNAGHLLLGGAPGVLKVRVIADMEFRIASAMERKGMNRKAAVQHIEDRDSKRGKWTKFLYHADWADPALYDMVINLEHMKIETACDIVCKVATSEEFVSNEKFEKGLDDFLLSAKVQAEIAEYGKVDDRNVHVKADGRKVVLSGSVKSLVDADRIREVTGNMSAVTEIESHLQVKSGYRF